MNKDGELMTNGRRRVYFWQSQLPLSTTLKYYSPPLRSKDFKQHISDFVTSTFVPGTVQALTSTMDGDVIVWDEQGLIATPGTSPTDRRASKVMKLHGSSIGVLKAIKVGPGLRSCLASQLLTAESRHIPLGGFSRLLNRLLCLTLRCWTCECLHDRMQWL